MTFDDPVFCAKPREEGTSVEAYAAKCPGITQGAFYNTIYNTIPVLHYTNFFYWSIGCQMDRFIDVIFLI